MNNSPNNYTQQKAYEPVWVVLPGREAVVSRLRAKAKACSELYLATDEDREGEAISWHLLDLLLKDENAQAAAAADPAHASSVAPTVPVHRVIFHEITPGAVGAGLENPRWVAWVCMVVSDSGGRSINPLK